MALKFFRRIDNKPDIHGFPVYSVTAALLPLVHGASPS
jgi:hypothetical protein